MNTSSFIDLQDLQGEWRVRVSWPTPTDIFKLYSIGFCPMAEKC